MKKTIAIVTLSIILCSAFAASKDTSRKKSKNIEVYNVGVSGNTSKDLRKRLDKDLLPLQPDLTIIMVGTNDMLNSRKFVSLADYKDNLNYIIKQLREADSEIVLMSPPPVDTAYLFTRHLHSAFTVEPNAKLDSVRMIMQELSEQKHIEFFDLNQVFVDENIPQHNEDMYIRNEMNSHKTDGVHPTAKGYNLIGESLYSFLCKNHLIKRKKCIACFGDSITYGAGSKGGGTIQGENYPSSLHRLINNQ